MAKAIDNTERDPQLRRRMLSIARLNQEHYAHGFIPFGLYAGARDDAGQTPDDDAHAERLLDSLVEWGLLEESPRLPMSGGATPTLRHRRYKFTTKGFQLWSREIPPMPGVADDRVI